MNLYRPNYHIFGINIYGRCISISKRNISNSGQSISNCGRSISIFGCIISIYEGSIFISESIILISEAGMSIYKNCLSISEGSISIYEGSVSIFECRVSISWFWIPISERSIASTWFSLELNFQYIVVFDFLWNWIFSILSLLSEHSACAHNPCQPSVPNSFGRTQASRVH